MAGPGGSPFASGVVLGLVAALTVTGCAAVGSQGDDATRLVRALEGSRTTSDDILAAARSAPGGLPSIPEAGTEAARVANALNNEYSETAAGLACSAFENRQYNIDVADPEAQQALADIWRAAGSEPGAETVIEFSCFLLEVKSSAQM